MPEQTRIVSPVPDPRYLRAEDGTILRPPAGWALLPPGDAGLTRRVKAAGPTWTVQERKGNKLFSRGVWAPAEHIDAARAALEAERATPEWQRRQVQAAERRAEAQAEYVEDFAGAVRRFLAFAPAFAAQEAALSLVVTDHATPVGSGTVARTKRIPVEERAAAAVIAWLRHQTTDYDDRRIERVRGARREVRRELAGQSRRLLDAHRGRGAHPAPCPLCSALQP